MKIHAQKLSVLFISLAALQVSANTNLSSNNLISNAYANPQVPSAVKSVANKSELNNPTDIRYFIPNLTVNNIVFIQSVVIPIDQNGQQKMDVTTLDGFIADVLPNARHYPPNFPTKTQRYNTQKHLEKYVAWIAGFADQDDASYDVLIRAAQLNGMARNLDMGSDYAVRGSNYVNRALDINSEDMEANLLYGIMLSEGGAFKTSLKYLNKAMVLGSVEAEQTLAQSDLMRDKRDEALLRLQNLQATTESATIHKQLTQQIEIIEQGKYRLWDLPAPDVRVKSLN